MKKLFTLILLFFSLSVWAGDYEDGMAAYETKNYTVALQKLEEAAKQGNIKAQSQLGLIYQEGEVVPQNYRLATKWLTLAAEKNDPQAQYILVYITDNGLAFSLEPEIYNKWLKSAFKQFTLLAKNNNKEAQYYLGRMYVNGMGTPVDIDTGIKWLKLAANQGYTLAELRLGTTYINRYTKGTWFDRNANNIPENLLKDYTEGIKWLNMAAEKGNEQAQLSLVNTYGNLWGPLKDANNSTKWRKATIEQWEKLAQEQNNAQAQYMLGTAYLSSNLGIKPDSAVALAVKWLTAAAEKNHDKAKLALQKLYEASGPNLNKELAKKWEESRLESWEKLALEENDPEALLNLGTAYFKGEGVKPNHEIAIELKTKAAKQGFIPAQYDLGITYSDKYGYGYGGPNPVLNQEKAFFWIKEAAEKGSSLARTKLSGFYGGDYGIPKNYMKVHMWRYLAGGSPTSSSKLMIGTLTTYQIKEGERLANLCKEQNYRNCDNLKELPDPNLAESLYQLGTLNINGQAPYPSSELAFESFKTAAELKHEKSQFMLAKMRFERSGVSQDYLKAYMWATMAKINKSTEAVTLIGDIENKLTPEELEKAKKMADECKSQEFKNCDNFKDKVSLQKN